MTLDEARSVVEEVSKKLDEDAKLIWGAQISEDMQNVIRTLLIVVGVHSPQIFGSRKIENEKIDPKKELGIDFIK